MARPPELTDRAALQLHRRRAARDPAYFLHEEAILDIQERLSEVNREFKSLAIITGTPDPWRQAFPEAVIVADEDILDLTPKSFDLVIHALALHWANDPVGQMVQARHALQPDGLFIAVFFGGQTLSELRAALAEAEANVLGGLSPRVAPMGEIRDLGALLQRAGLALPVADGFARTVTYQSAFHLMRDLRAMGETNALAQRLRRPVPRRFFAETARIYAQAFPAPENRIRATFEMIYLTGWAPHESQQKPLRPGSAAHRLAEALQSEEFRLPRDGSTE
ncbi:methyltransferase domain-containing protein [Thioclava sp. BHET1]|nr:methyltransferase domain-containing protein [Thioclava sp. BHET1]